MCKRKKILSLSHDTFAMFAYGIFYQVECLIGNYFSINPIVHRAYRLWQTISRTDVWVEWIHICIDRDRIVIVLSPCSLVGMAKLLCSALHVSAKQNNSIKIVCWAREEEATRIVQLCLRSRYGNWNLKRHIMHVSHFANHMTCLHAAPYEQRQGIYVG